MELAKNAFAYSQVYTIKDTVDYASGSVVSKIITRNSAGNVTLFAFDDDQFLSEHTAPFDAMIQILEGKAMITIDGQKYDLSEGEMIIIPANIPHAVNANGKFKMLLTMVKEK